MVIKPKWISNATTSRDGLMSKEDKTKLNNLMPKFIGKKYSGGSNSVTFENLTLDGSAYFCFSNKNDATYNYGSACLILNRGTKVIQLGGNYSITVQVVNNSLKISIGGDSYAFISLYSI